MRVGAVGLARRGGLCCLRALALVAAVLAAATGMAGCGGGKPRPTQTSAASSGLRLPRTPAGRQAAWLFAAAPHAPLSTSELEAHFDAVMLARVSPAHLNETFVALRSIRVDSVKSSAPSALRVIVTVNGKARFGLVVSVDGSGLISNLAIVPVGVSAPGVSAPAAPDSWGSVVRDFRSVAPRVSFVVASVSRGGCEAVQGSGASTVMPLASSFKLYVLDALARAIAAGTVSWSQPLTVTAAVKSVPSGILQDEPDGTTVTVQQAATDMIQISDNTATDMLISLLGRRAVEQATRATHMANPERNVPFLTTRERFVLETYDWPELADRYLSMNAAGRQRLLRAVIDRVPLASIEHTRWSVPRDIASIEWFASPIDMCRLYGALLALSHQRSLTPLQSILRLPGQAGLPSSKWAGVWFKGGSEPGVLTVNYLATARSGRSYVVSVLAANPSASIPPTATITLARAVTGALGLANP